MACRCRGRPRGWYSIAPTPGYSVAWIRLRMFGDGLIQGSPVSSNQRRAPVLHGDDGEVRADLVLGVEQLRQLADRHRVADRHRREVAGESDRRLVERRPSIWKPLIGFGRSARTTGGLRFAASSMT